MAPSQSRYHQIRWPNKGGTSQTSNLAKPWYTSCQNNRECGCRQQGAHRRVMNPGPERSQVYSGFRPRRNSWSGQGRACRTAVPTGHTLATAQDKRMPAPGAATGCTPGKAYSPTSKKGYPAPSYLKHRRGCCKLLGRLLGKA